MDLMCTICQDRMNTTSMASSGHCGHIFHYSCLLTWLEQKPNCPACRSHCPSRQIIRLFAHEFDSSGLEAVDLSLDDLKVENGRLKNNLKSKEDELKAKDDKMDNFRDENGRLKSELESKCQGLLQQISENSSLTKILGERSKELRRLEKYRTECLVLKERLALVEGVEKTIRGSKQEVADEMLKYQGDSSPAACNRLATFHVMLKREFEVMRTKKKEALEQRDKLQKERVVERSERQKLEMQLKISEGKVRERDRDIEHLEGEIKSLKAKVEVLQKAFESPGTRTKLTRILESPLPSLKRPRFSFPVEDEEEEDFPLYRRPETKQTQSDAASQENQSPASSQEGPSSSSSSSSSSSLQQSHTAPAPIPGNLQLQQKLAKRETMSSFMRKGYNGLGGHSKFRLPSKPASKGPAMKPTNSIKFKGPTSKPPPLPNFKL
ncbi:E3 ubiquitin-protein ligase TRAIP-like [Oscarella lobularis]|uniref:E3 ubiquitin-protein ligase TRAIP-like n=1 Tax=Oscarella lobularis TaxID=121494 RepID=UPI003313BDF2